MLQTKQMSIVGITKRDGRTVSFSVEKIAGAIEKAFAATYRNESYELAQKLAGEVVSILEVEGESCPDVERIQDVVERVLMDNGYIATAKAYILYRSERSRQREMKTRLMQRYEEIAFAAAGDSDIKRENANIDGDTAMGVMLKFGSEGAKQFYHNHVLNEKHAKAHEEGEIHIHDLDFLSLTTTCCQIDITKLFEGGFSTGHGTLREPNDINSYAALACIAIQSNQNDQHGGQSIGNFDYGMAEGVKKTFVRLYRQNLAKALMLWQEMEDPDTQLREMIQDIKTRTQLVPTLEGTEAYQAEELRILVKQYENEADMKRVQTQALYHARKETDRACFQAMEAFIHNLNTMHSRAGAQTPFSSINYGLDTSPEGRMVMKNVMLTTEQGLGGGETPIFPIQVFRVKEGINLNEGEPNYDLFQLACRVSAKRLFPNFSFVDAPFNLKFYEEGNPETEIAYKGCRTRVISNVHDPKKEVVSGRGNLSFSSINLPRLAVRAKGDIPRFFEDLDAKIDLIIEQLLERFEIQAQKKVKNFPFLMGQGIWQDSDKLQWEDEVREVLKHGTLTLGFIGLAESLTALIGEHHGESERAQSLGLEIIGHMRKRLDMKAAEMKLNFSLIATPAEGLAGRFVRMDKKLFGNLVGITDKDYYTNGFHVPVGHALTAFEKIRIEAPYHALTNAGHISYVEMDGDPSENLEAFEKIVRFMQQSGIGYGSINHPIDRDPVCGFSGIIKDQCPGCGRIEDDVPFDRIRRITGYLVGTLGRFNNAKQAEERERIKHC